jgi:hypothetical protein
MSRKGDLKLSWNIDNEAEVEAAHDMFKKYVIYKKWSAFREKILGSKGDKIKLFDANAARIILVPPISGG